MIPNLKKQIEMKHKSIVRIAFAVAALAWGGVLAAQEQAASGTDPHYVDRVMTNIIIVMGAVVVIMAFYTIVRLFSLVTRMQELEYLKQQGVDISTYLAQQEQTSWWERFKKRMTKAVPVEREEEVMFDHEYDGIRELDNSLPPWWVALFYLTIIWGVAYLGYYHLLGYGPSSAEEFAMEMEQAEKAVAAYKAQMGVTIDENTVTLLTDEQELAVGQTLFETHCAACHLSDGSGQIGPNLTDEYWIHGCSIKDVFRTISEGVPEKGMIAWKSQLRPQDIQRVSSYILVELAGTNKPGKDREGEKCQPQAMGDEAPTTEVTGEEVGLND